MKKLTLLSIMALLLVSLNTQNAEAQYEKGAFVGNGHINLNLPTGDLGDAANVSFGIGINGQYYILENLAIQGTISYISWSTDVDGISFSTVEILPGVRYYLTRDRMSWYIGGDIGFYSNGVDYEGLGSDSETDFGLAPFGGFTYQLSEKVDLDINLRYSIVDDWSWFGIKAGINYNFSK